MPLERVRQIIKDQLNVPDVNITLGSSFDKDLSADSLDMIEIVVACEDVFQIDISDENLPKIKTIGNLVDVITECSKNAIKSSWIATKYQAAQPLGIINMGVAAHHRAHGNPHVFNDLLDEVDPPRRDPDADLGDIVAARPENAFRQEMRRIAHEVAGGGLDGMRERMRQIVQQHPAPPPAWDDENLTVEPEIEGR